MFEFCNIYIYVLYDMQLNNIIINIYEVELYIVNNFYYIIFIYLFVYIVYYLKYFI